LLYFFPLRHILRLIDAGWGKIFLPDRVILVTKFTLDLHATPAHSTCCLRVVESNLMASDPNTPNFLSPKVDDKASRSPLPWVIAGGVIIVVVALIFVFGGKKTPPANPGGANLAPADPYAANLPITDIKMSESTNFAGGKVTYVDGHIVNNGNQIVTGVTVQVGFHDFGNLLVQKETMPLTLIRMREPYVDTESVTADPIKPGDQRDFRLVLDHVANEWNGQYPEVRIIQVTGK
jgi:hypothetical protein